MRQCTTQLQPAWFFWFFAGYTALTMIAFAYLAFDFVTHPFAPEASLGSVGYRLFTGLVIVPLGLIVSVLVLRRTRRNVTGLFLLIWTVQIMATTLRLDSPVSSQLFRFTFIGLWLLPLYFPDGQPVPARFARWIRLHAVLMALGNLALFVAEPTLSLTSTPGQTVGVMQNPIYVPLPESIKATVGSIAGLLWGSLVLFIVPSIVLRYRASGYLVRQQIKWFVWAFGVIIVWFLVLFLSHPVQDSSRMSTVDILAGIAFRLCSQLAPFLVVGNAIIRHKLYDIDIIIRRTLIYSVLTTILAVIYFGAIILTQQLFRATTGETPDIAIVLSTLLIAMLFSPIRRRVQDVIDRRLYRRKYDVEKTLAQFQHNLRDEVDMETLKANLIGVVNDTMQPTKMALWVREE